MSVAVAYEQYLRAEPDEGLKEASMHFEKAGPVHATLHRLASKLDQLGVAYSIAGAMALYYHGYQRFTVDVDFLVDREGLKKLHDALEGLGYVPPFAGSKNLRDTETGVKIDFLIAGDYPGDGKPKPVAFPDPRDASVRIDGLSFLPLHKLFELKLASGMSNQLRLKDISDVQEAVKVLHPPDSLGDEMDPSVRGKFLEICKLVRESRPDDY